MNYLLKNILHAITPPIALDTYRLLSNRSTYHGIYKTWEEARSASTGYDSDIILNKVKEALLKVKNGEAVYERDSVLFDKIEYSWPLLAGLLWIASKNNNKLNLVDFGGSLGSSYYQNRGFLSHLDDLTWDIVEQDRFVNCGKKYFQDRNLNFFNTLEECQALHHPDTILMCSVLQYLERPYEMLEHIAGKYNHVIFDRTPFWDAAGDIVTVHHVPSEIYRASIPTWIFAKDNFLKYFSEKYDITTEFDNYSQTIGFGKVIHWKGFIFTSKKE